MICKRCVVAGVFAAVVAARATLLAETCVVATGSNLGFDAKSGKKSLRLPDVRIPVPGNITMRVKTFHSITNGWRRFFASEYRQTGYFGFQEMPGSQEIEDAIVEGVESGKADAQGLRASLADLQFCAANVIRCAIFADGQ